MGRTAVKRGQLVTLQTAHLPKRCLLFGSSVASALLTIASSQCLHENEQMMRTTGWKGYRRGVNFVQKFGSSFITPVQRLCPLALWYLLRIRNVLGNFRKSGRNIRRSFSGMAFGGAEVRAFWIHGRSNGSTEPDLSGLDPRFQTGFAMMDSPGSCFHPCNGVRSRIYTFSPTSSSPGSSPCHCPPPPRDGSPSHDDPCKAVL